MSSRNATPDWLNGAEKILLSLGFAAFIIGLLSADAHQATVYELSILNGTPVIFWAGIGVALIAALTGAFTFSSRRIRFGSILLGGMSVTAIAGLPVLREYYFHGTADALTHLGWARDIASGATIPLQLFYPGIHEFAVILHSLTGLMINRTLLYVVVSLSVVTLVFVPLVVRSVTNDEFTITVACFSGFLLFMVHNLGVYLHAHSFAQATFFSALVLFLVVAYLTRDGRAGFGVMLGIVSLSVVLFHPQQALNLLLVFGAISFVQLYFRWKKPDHTLADHQPLYAHTGFLTVVFLGWITRFDGWAFANILRVEEALLAYLGGRPPVAGESVQTQATSLSAIGSGVPEMFLKLFLVAAIYTVLSGALFFAVSLGYADDTRNEENALTRYLAYGSIAIVPITVVYFAGNIAEHYFRHIGFLLLIATIVGAIALSRGLQWLSERNGRRTITVITVVLFAILLPLSLASVFPTPYIHKQTQHLTEPQMDGYRTTLEINDEALPLGGIRQAPWRYSDAIEGVSDVRPYRTTVTNRNLTRLPETYDEGGYLVVTTRDRAREVGAYEELRYTARAFRSLQAQSNVDQIVSNNEFTLYHVSEAAD